MSGRDRASAPPPVVTREEWLAARAALLEKEKAHTRAGDRLAAERRRLPRERVDERYAFDTPEGPASLVDLFGGCRQLVVYHHMLRPADPAPCSGCSMVADGIPHLAHLRARDVGFVMVARAPLDEIEDFRSRMGWSIPFVATLDGFSADFGVTDGFGLNVFLREGDAIYRTWFTSGRGVEALGSVWSLLDIAPFGRQERWEEAPEGTPQGEPYAWWRLHDRYGSASKRG